LIVRNQRALAGRQRNGVFVIDVAAAVAEIRNGALRLEAKAVRLVDRVARDPELVAGHAGAAAALVASHRALLLHDLSDAGAPERARRNGALVVHVAAAVAEKGDGALRLEAEAMILVVPIALDPQLLTGLRDSRHGRQHGGARHYRCDNR